LSNVGAGLQFSNDLIILVTGPTGKMLRAFATNATVDLDPGSELAVRLVLERIASTPGATLSDFTLKEVNDFSASVKLLTTVQQLAGGADLETTIATVRNSVLAEADLMAFLAAAAAAGQTTQGPGDVGNRKGTPGTFKEPTQKPGRHPSTFRIRSRSAGPHSLVGSLPRCFLKAILTVLVYRKTSM
jgi:hypothetical protein